MATLTHLQQNFVEIRTDPANNDMADYVCYRKAGYSAPTNAVATAGAARLLATVSVATAITKIMARRQARREERIAVTAQWAQQRLLDLYERNLAQNDLAEARRTVGDLVKLCGLLPASSATPSIGRQLNVYADLGGRSMAELEAFDAELVVEDARALPEADVSISDAAP